jgi:hypothetical protein
MVTFKMYRSLGLNRGTTTYFSYLKSPREKDLATSRLQICMLDAATHFLSVDTGTICIRDANDRQTHSKNLQASSCCITDIRSTRYSFYGIKTSNLENRKSSRGNLRKIKMCWRTLILI